MAATVQSAIATASVLHDLESGRANLLGDDNNEKKDDGLLARFGLVTLLALALGGLGIIFNLLSMILVASPVVIVAGIVALIVAPVIMKRQVEMDDKGGLRRVHNQLRATVNQLSGENTKLCGHVNDLQVKVKSLRHFETELAAIAKENEHDVDTLVRLVKENGEIIKSMRQAIEAAAVAGVVDTFLDSDRDESASLDEKEIQILTLRLSKLDGITVNQELFQAKVKEDSSMQGILAILHASMRENADSDDKVFTFFEEETKQDV